MADRDDPSGPHARFRSRAGPDIVANLLAVLDAHVAIDADGFVAVDLYDGCLLWDGAAPPGRGVHLIELDEYRAGPFDVDAPLSGSTRFMAPEDWIVGERVDRRSSVHALADDRRAAGCGRVRGRVCGGPALATVVQRGSSPDRERRFAAVASLRSAVQHALDLDPSG